jgi:hypothetical protein
MNRRAEDNDETWQTLGTGKVLEIGKFITFE